MEGVRNAEAIAAFTFEKTLAGVYFESVLRMISTFGLQKVNELSVNARHPHEGASCVGRGCVVA